MDDERRRGLMERVTIGALVLLVAVVVVDQVIDGGGSSAPPPGDVAGASGPDGRTADGTADAPRSDTVAAKATVAETAARAARAESAAAAAPETVADRTPEEQPRDRTPEEPTGEVAEAPARTAEPRTAEAGDTPELLDLRVGSRLLTVPVGSEGSVRVAVGKDGRPRAGVPLVLDGSESLPGVGRRLEAVTDSAGTAVFRFAAGAVPDTVAMRVLARGYWLQGDNRVTLRVVP